MHYEAPSYQELQNRTDQLHDSFNKIANRYLPPEFENLDKNVITLRADYLEKAKKSSRFFPLASSNIGTRTAQIDCITELAEKLRPLASINKDQAKEILLGAIIYRYLRLENQSHLFESNLHSILKDILMLKKHNPPNQLDPQSILSCTEAYRDYVTPSKAVKLFPYIEKNSNYLPDLEKLIEENTKKAEPITRQLRCIEFIQQIGKSLQTVERILLTSINSLVQVVESRFEKNQDLIIPERELNQILQKLLPHKQSFDYSLLQNALPEAVTIKGVRTTEDGQYLSFKDYVETQLTYMKRSILIAAYLITEKSFAKDFPSLKKTLTVALGDTYNHLESDIETQEVALHSLKNYLELNQLPQIDYSVWNKDQGINYLKKNVENAIAKLNTEIVPLSMP